MEIMDWQRAAGWLALGLAGGAVFWLLARAGLMVAAYWPHRLPFAADVLANAGERDRLRHRREGYELATLLAATLAAAIVALTGALLLDEHTLPGWPAWAWLFAWLINLALLCAGVYGIVRLLNARRRARFEWAARCAIGNVLKRLNLSGNRVFHEVSIEGATVDHVVLGTRGVFAINVVPRPVPGNLEGRPTAELKNGKLRLAGRVEALPVGDAARNMTLLSGALSRVVGHRVPVRSVLAVPGWHSVPDDKGNHLVLNESNLAMLTSWNTPDAYLMDEDCLAIQAFLHDASRARQMD